MKSDQKHTIEMVIALMIAFPIAYISGYEIKIIVATAIAIFAVYIGFYLWGRILHNHIKERLPHLVDESTTYRICPERPRIFGVNLSYYLSLVRDSVTLEIRHMTDDSGRHHEIYYIPLELDFAISISRESLWTKIDKFTGATIEVEIGNQTLDKAYLIKTNDLKKAKEILLTDTKITNALMNWGNDSNFKGLRLNPTDKNQISGKPFRGTIINNWPGIIIDREHIGGNFIKDATAVRRILDFAFMLEKLLRTTQL